MKKTPTDMTLFSLTRSFMYNCYKTGKIPCSFLIMDIFHHLFKIHSKYAPISLITFVSLLANDYIIMSEYTWWRHGHENGINDIHRIDTHWRFFPIFNIHQKKWCKTSSNDRGLANDRHDPWWCSKSGTAILHWLAKRGFANDSRASRPSYWF